MYNITNEKFSGIKHIGDHLFLSQIENNIKGFLDWGFLNIGGFINVSRPDKNIHGNPLAKLKPTEDPNFSNGQVWQTMRKDWIWEHDVVYSRCIDNPLPSGTISIATPCPLSILPLTPCPESNIESISPILIDGLYINNTFYPINTVGSFSYKVDYINSRIIFNSPIPLSSVVEMEYSYRWLQVYNYDNAQWWRQLQYQTDSNIQHFNQLNKGDFSILSNNRVQLPAIIIETVARGLSRPWQMGDKSLIMKQEIVLHIVSETMADRNKILDILRLQQDKIIRMYDTNLVIKYGIQPFLIDGTLNVNRLKYDDLIMCGLYKWNSARLIDIFASEVESFSPFFSESNVKLTVEIIFDIRD
jgi:hypothetical protein